MDVCYCIETTSHASHVRLTRAALASLTARSSRFTSNVNVAGEQLLFVSGHFVGGE